MPLDFELKQAPFRFGLAEGVDPRQVPLGTLVTAENCVWRKNGRIEKRYGTSQLSRSILGGGTLSAGARLFTRGAELVAIDGPNVYSYSSGDAAWVRVDQVPNVGLTWSTTLDTYAGVSAHDSALSAAGLIVTAWVVGDPTTVGVMGNVFVTVVDRATRATVVPATNLNLVGFGVRVLISGTNAFIITRAAAGLNFGMYVRSIDLTTGTINATTSLRGVDDAAQTAWDATLIGGKIVIAYENTSNALKLYAYTYTGPATYTQSATGGVTGEAGNTFRSIAIDGVSAERIWVAYYVNSSTKVRVAAVSDSTLAQTIAPFDVEAVTASNVSVIRTSTTTCTVGYSMTDATSGRVTTRVATSAGAITAGAQRGTWGTRLISRLFALSGRVFAFVADIPLTGFTVPVTVDSALVEVEASSIGALSDYVPHRYVGRLDPLIGGISVDGILASAAAVSASEAIIHVPFLSAAAQKAVNWRCGLRLADVTIGSSLPADMWRSVTYGAESYVAAGLVCAYDGRNVFDYGFPRAPVVTTVGISNPAGNIAAGAYLYKWALEYRSAVGVLHRGGTRGSVGITAGGTPSQFSISFLPVSLTAKQKISGSTISPFGSTAPNPILHGIYRSIANGTTYYRETYEPAYNVVISDVTTQSATFVDGNADSNIGGSTGLAVRPTLYTTGGVLDDDQPPSCTTIALYRGRLWAVDGSRRAIWFSKSFLDDFGVAPGFSTSYRFLFDQDITGLIGMDEKLVIFWSGGLWILGGDGPAPDGTGSDFGLPVAVQTDTGCSNPRSLVAIPDGVMFQAGSGKLYLLTRGLEMKWIGRAVADELAAYPNITSATLDAANSVVRFTANNAGGTAGIVLVFNYAEGQWSTAKYTVNGVYGAPIADACMWNGAWTFITPSGYVHTESTATYRDAGATWVPMTIETAWISAAGPLTFQSVRSFQLEGYSNTDHDLTIACTFDGDTSYPQTRTFTATGAVTAVGPLEQAEISVGTRRKCQHIRFKVADATPSAGSVGSGQGPSFDTMGVEIGVKRGFAPNPATKKG